MLITLRRSLAIVLIPLFLVLFVATLLVFRVNGTLLDADFYTSTLNKLDAFNFLYDEAIPAVLEESDVDLGEDLPLGLDLTPTGVASLAEDVFPPEWLESNVGVVINEAIPYITGSADTFSITVQLDDRVDAAAEVVRTVIADAAIYDYVLDDIVAPQIDAQRDDLADLPYGISLTTTQILDGVRTVVPETWLVARIEDALDVGVPYVTGRTDSFALTIPLQDRASVGLVVVEEWLRLSLDGGAYDYLLNEQIAPLVTGNLGAVVALPFGITLDNQDVVDAVAGVLPADWIADRVGEAIDAVGPYLTGETDTFTLVIPLEDRLNAAVTTLVDVTESKFRAFYEALPVCTPVQLLSLNLSLDETPPCRPPIVTYEDLKGLVGLDVIGELVTSIVEPLPKSIELDEVTLFQTLGENVGGFSVDDVREILRDGYVFTDADLRSLIADFSEGSGTGALEIFEDVRGWLRDGYTVTDADVRDRFDADFETFDDGRGWVSTGRSLLFVLFILLALIAAIIGFLGGRKWGSRLAWAGVPILLSGGLLAAAFIVIKRFAVDASDDAINDLGIDPVFITKILSVRDEMWETFISPLTVQGIAAGALGLAMMVVGIFLSSRARPKDA